MAFVLCVGINSCKDKDEPVNVAKAVAGTYSGTATAGDLSIPNLSINFAFAEKTKVNVSIIGKILGYDIDPFSATVKATSTSNSFDIEGSGSVPFPGLSLPPAFLIKGKIVVGDTKTIELKITIGAGLAPGADPTGTLPLELQFVGKTN